MNLQNSSFNSGDAYYEMVYRNHGGLLLKTDYATAAQTVACTVPGCTHDSADCPAWFPGRYRYYCPFVADGAVYVLNATLFHTDRTWEEYREEYLTPQLDSTDLTPEELEAHYYGLWQQQSAAPQVYRLTDDGKTCIDLPAECVDYVFDFCDDAALYGTMTSGNNGQDTKAVRIDLTTTRPRPCRPSWRRRKRKTPTSRTSCSAPLPSMTTTASAPSARLTRSSTTVCPTP